MKYSKMFGKTVREAKRDMSVKSHALLYQAGYIRESVAGRYFFLPLGQRVMDKITKVIETEMDRAGAQKMYSPILHPLELWKETNRNNEAGFELMKISDRRGAEFALGGTGEEMFVDVVRRFRLSYKDLPFNIYQFGQKFRDELRASGGLLRVREFTMKDAYSFDRNEEEFKKEYENMADAYTKMFKSFGLDALKVAADGGYIGGDSAHEYIVESEIGESTYFVSEDGTYIAHEDVAKFQRDEPNADEEIKPMEVIDQPEWVQTMEDNQKHYQQPLWRFLKNVVYKNRTTGEIIIVVMRGDLQANRTKLEKRLDMVGQLEDATDEDLASFGSKSGFIHAWGHEGVRYVGDISLKSVRNFIGGQKENNTDTINVNYGRDFECEIIDDFALAQDGFISESGSVLNKKIGIEVGNIFQLGYHYSSKMKGAVFVDSDGKEKEFYMGCYGIGLGRTMATIVEKYNDERGIVWPITVAPFQVHMVSLAPNENVLGAAQELYDQLWGRGIEVLWDDRNEQPGVKFADADMIGIPIRLVVSARGLVEDHPQVEVKKRDSPELEMVDLNQAVNYIKDIVNKLNSELIPKN